MPETMRWERSQGAFKGNFFSKRFMKIYTFPIFHPFFPLNFWRSLWLAGFEFKFLPPANHKLRQKFRGKKWMKNRKNVHFHKPFWEKVTFNTWNFSNSIDYWEGIIQKTTKARWGRYVVSHMSKIGHMIIFSKIPKNVYSRGVDSEKWAKFCLFSFWMPPNVLFSISKDCHTRNYDL